MSCLVASCCKKCPKSLVGVLGFVALILAVVLSVFFIKYRWNSDLASYSIESALRCPSWGQDYCSPPTILHRWNGTVQSESTVAETGLFHGSHPVLYSLNLTFASKTRFHGSLNIHLEVHNETDVIVLNSHPDLSVDWNTVTLQPICKQNIVCLKNVFVLDSAESVVLQFVTALQPGWYMLHVGGIKGQILQNQPQGDRGLFLRKTRASWVVGTLFQMRYARTVFPCYDHPALKSHFQLCVGHEAGVEVASNMPAVNWLASGATNRTSSVVTTCFQMTPVLPIYVFSVSLYQGMDKVTISPDNLPRVTTLTPSDMAWMNPSIASWMLPEARRILDTMTNITAVQFPLPELIFVNTPSAPFWGIENAGLVTLDLDMTKVPMYEEAHTILVHEIIHQWLGNLFTIDTWDNICLQEGLTAYMETVLASELLHESSVESKLGSIAAGAMRTDEGRGTVVRHFHKTNDIADVCFNKPPVIFHMIDVAFDKASKTLLSTVSKLLTYMCTNYAYATAGLDQWARALSQVTEDEQAGLVLKSYLTYPGYPILMVTLNDGQSNGTSMNIVQRTFEADRVVDTGRYFTIPPVQYLGSNSMSMYLPSLTPNPNVTVSLPETSAVSWFVLDAQFIAYAKIVYSAKNYLTLLDCFHPQSGVRNADCVLPSSVNKFRIFDDLCWAMNYDLFPIPGDTSPGDVWRQLLHRLAQLADDSTGQPRLRLKGKELNCECCFKMLLLKNNSTQSKPKVDSRFNSYFSCDNDKQLCKDLRVMKMVL